MGWAGDWGGALTERQTEIHIATAAFTQVKT